MKQLTRIRLVNWHLFTDATITCQGSTYFLGVNGAGKSTVLDAVQFALVGGQRDVKFNQAALANSRRTLSSYVRGELGTEGQRFLRGDCTGLVALEFANDDGTHFVHGALVDAYQDNHSPDITYFIVHNAPLNDAWFFRTPGRLFDTGAFRRHLEHFALPTGAKAQTFTRLEDYRANLLNRLGQLRDTFVSKLVKGVAFSPLTNIRDFVHNYLLDEALVDVRTLQEQLETMRHFEALVADIVARIAALDGIAEVDAERLANRRRRLTNGFVRRQAEADLILADLKRHRLQRDEADLGLQRVQLTREGLAESLKFAQERLVEAQIALQTDRTAARQSEIGAAIARAESDLAGRERLAAETAAALAAEHRAMQALAGLVHADGRPLPPALAEALARFGEMAWPPSPFAETGRGDGWETLAPLVHSLPSTLADLGQSYADRRALVVERMRLLADEGARQRQELARLRTGDHEAGYETEAPAAARLRRLLRAELGLDADEVVYLCQVLEVRDEAWQDAVEGLLGPARFHLLVPPSHYDAALRLYRDRRFQDDLHGVGLVDGERLLAAAASASPASPPANRLAAEVRTGHPTARAYLDLLLGGYVKCESVEELRTQRQGVTRDCFVRRQFTTSHLDPNRYRRWFIGSRALPRRIAERAAQVQANDGELAVLTGQLAGLDQRLALTRDRVRGLIDLEGRLPELERLPEVRATLTALQTELASLDAVTLTALTAEVQAAKAAVAEAQRRLSEADQAVGDQRRLLLTLDSEILPALTQQGAAAVQGVAAFLHLEEAEPLGEEAEREYARRRERQPLEIVRDNAARYEDDYARAEVKCRDRLLEAKKDYSVRYDFGYDSQEDAGRYALERQRYVETELPDYESRVARQRGLAEQELVENFIHRLREQIEDARSQLDHLNSTLSRLRFGGERYEFLASPAPELRPVYDMVMDSRAVLGASLFDSDFRRSHQQGWDLLFERLTIGAKDERAEELRRLQDYRNYLSYDIRIHYPNGDRALHSQINAKKSGGETTTPFYVAMAASFAQAYRLNQARPSDTIRLAIFDEAFGKMDTARTASALKFMIDTGLQVLLATPPDKASGLLPHVDSVRTVVRQNNHAFVLEIDKREAPV